MKHLRLVGPEDPGLRRRSLPLDLTERPISGGLAEEMLRLLRKHRALGLAAIQVGVPIHAFVIRVDGPSGHAHDVEYLWFANTEVTPHPDAVMERAKEGCLSLPGQQFWVERPNRICMRFTSPWDGKTGDLEADGLVARVIQHEHDHCEGRLISDHGTPVDG